MRIAYIVLAHKQPKQLIRLVSRLDSSETTFFIHIDKRTKSAVYLEIVNGLQRLPNVHFVRRCASRWGEFGLVRATLEGIAEIFRRQVPIDYVVLLTGQDYPIKTNVDISAFLERSAGRSYLDHNPVPCSAWPEAAKRMRSWHVRILGRPFLLPRRDHGRAVLCNPRKWPILVLSYCLPKKRRPLKGYKPTAGSAYWVLSRTCAQYVDDFVKTNRSFVRYFKRVCCPDEVFFQTVLINSHLSEEIVSSNLRYIDWSMSGAHPAILTAVDLGALVNSPALFARKFDVDVDETILQLVDESILQLPPPKLSHG